MERKRQGLYDDAEIYDILHTPGTSGDVRGLLKIEQRWVKNAPGERHAAIWLEPACGTGRLVIEAARRGRRCVGFDRSSSMIAFARRRARELGLSALAGFGVAEMAAFTGSVGVKPASVSLAFNPINTIRHLGSDHAMLAHFKQIAAVLRPGGVYVVGLSLFAPGVEGPTEDLWHATRGPVHVKQVVEYEPAGWRRADGTRNPIRRERVTSTLIVTEGQGAARTERQLDDSYWLRSYTRAQWTQLIAKSALRLLASVDEVGRPHDPGDLGYAIWLLTPR